MRKILHWLACHSVLVVLFVFLVVAVVFRAELFGITPSEASAKSSQQPGEVSVMPQQEPLLQEPQIQETVNVIPEQATVETPVEMPAETPLEQAASGQEPDTAPELTLDLTPDLIQEPSPDVLPESQIAPEPAVSEVSLPGKNGFEFRPEEKATSARSGSSDNDLKIDLIQQARRAYWNDQLNKAKSLYLAYIDLDPENPDGYGELGNLLGTTGDLDAAEQMYLQAAQLLTEQGRLEEADQLNQVLESINVIKKSQ